MLKQILHLAMGDLGPAVGLVGLIAGLCGLGGLLALVPLFIDYRKRGQIHKPLIYVAVLLFTLAVVLPILIKVFGVWLALIAPFAVLGYALLTRSTARRR